MDITNPQDKADELTLALKNLLFPLTPTDVGLGNVQNTADLNKPISILVQQALNLKASLISPVFAGIPTAPTAVVGTDTDQIATAKFVNSTVESYIDISTDTLEILKQLAEQLGDDPDSIGTLFEEIGNKLDKSANLGDLLNVVAARSNLGLGSAALSNAIDFATVSHTHPLANETDAGFISAAEKAKLTTVQAGATANQTDAFLLSRTNHTGTQAISTVNGLQTALDSKQATIGYTPLNAAEKGANNGIAPLGSDGKINETYLPSVAITDTYVVANESAMLNLTAQRGDVAVRTDLQTTFILQATPATSIDNWVELKVPGGVVTSVAGKTGPVTLVIADIANLQSTLTAQQGNIDLKAPLASPALTGTPTVPTAALGTNTTQAASTAHVVAAIAAAKVSPAFSGSPTAPTPTAGDNTTLLSTTAFVNTAIAAAKVSPAFTGTPTVPTLVAGDKSTTIANSQFVSGEITTAVAAEASVRQAFDTVLRRYIRGYPGIAIETTTNNWVRSQEFDQSDWTKSNVTVTMNAATAPDGTMSMDKIVETAATATSHSISQVSKPLTEGKWYVQSWFVKAAERSVYRIRAATNIGFLGDNYFDLSNGTILSPAPANTKPYIEDWGGGIYRIGLAALTPTGTTAAGGGLYLCKDATPTVTYDGEVGKGAYVWGGQLELDTDTMGPYIKTFGAIASGSTYPTRRVVLRSAPATLSTNAVDFSLGTPPPGAELSAIIIDITSWTMSASGEQSAQFVTASGPVTAGYKGGLLSMAATDTVRMNVTATNSIRFVWTPGTGQIASGRLILRRRGLGSSFWTWEIEASLADPMVALTAGRGWIDLGVEEPTAVRLTTAAGTATLGGNAALTREYD